MSYPLWPDSNPESWSPDWYKTEHILLTSNRRMITLVPFAVEEANVCPTGISHFLYIISPAMPMLLLLALWPENLQGDRFSTLPATTFSDHRVCSIAREIMGDCFFPLGKDQNDVKIETMTSTAFLIDYDKSLTSPTKDKARRKREEVKCRNQTTCKI